MAKVGFSFLTPIKSKEDVTITFNDKEIVVKQYLPVKEKAELVDYIIQSSFDNKGLYSPIRQIIYETIGMLKFYTNINFTEAMLINVEKTYDSIQLNNLEIILDNIPEEERLVIDDMITDAVIETKDYIRSFAGQLQATKNDYDLTNMDMDKMSALLQDPQQMGFLKELMEKMG